MPEDRAGKLKNEAFNTSSAPARWLWSPSAGQSGPDCCWDRRRLSRSPGPAVILSFILAAFITLTMTLALGELSSMHPAAGSFGVYGDLYLNQWAGFIARAGYWVAISISIGAELVASATYLAYWFPSVPALFWVVIFSVVLLLINLRSVGNYARFEYWFAMIKVATIAAFIVLGAGLLLSGRVAPRIHRAWRILSQGTAGAPARNGLRSLHLRRTGICRHHDRRVYARRRKFLAPSS